MKTVAIIEGFAGGPRSSKNFRQALRKAGFEISKNRREAEIIIAHSAGIYGIPVKARAKLIMLIGPTYWPGQRLLKRLIKHNLRSGKYHVKQFGWRSYGAKWFRQVYYFFRRHRYLWLGIKHNNKLDHIIKLAAEPERTIILIRNQDDPFASPEIKELLAKHRNIRHVSLAGTHDDYYTNPQPYIGLIKKHL